jgi:hypothetical protein
LFRLACRSRRPLRLLPLMQREVEKMSEWADIDVRMIRLIETKGQNLSVNVAECLAQGLWIPLSQMICEAEDLRRTHGASKWANGDNVV